MNLKTGDQRLFDNSNICGEIRAKAQGGRTSQVYVMQLLIHLKSTMKSFICLVWGLHSQYKLRLPYFNSKPSEPIHTTTTLLSKPEYYSEGW